MCVRAGGHAKDTLSSFFPLQAPFLACMHFSICVLLLHCVCACRVACKRCAQLLSFLVSTFSSMHAFLYLCVLTALCVRARGHAKDTLSSCLSLRAPFLACMRFSICVSLLHCVCVCAGGHACVFHFCVESLLHCVRCTVYLCAGWPVGALQCPLFRTGTQAPSLVCAVGLVLLVWGHSLRQGAWTVGCGCLTCR